MVRTAGAFLSVERRTTQRANQEKTGFAALRILSYLVTKVGRNEIADPRWNHIPGTSSG
jgi:hypothetical protein